MTEQKPQQLLRTCMETAVRLALIRHNIELDPDAATEEEIAADAAGACFGEECCDDKPIPEVSALLAELAQVKAERDAQRSIKEAEKKILLQEIETSTALRGLCRELAVGLVKHGVHLFNCPVCNFGSTRCGDPGCECAEAACTCGFEALLSRPEVVKLLEKEKV